MTTHLSSPSLGAATTARIGPIRRRRFVAARLWPWVPAMLLVGLVGTQLTVLASVLDDPTFATEGDYYRKAVDWDAHMARQRRSQALGWTARARTAESGSASLQLVVEIADARGVAISGARAHGVAFPNVRADRPLELALEEATPGVYRATLPMPRAGLWELRLLATRGADAYETTLRFDLAPDRRSP